MEGYIALGILCILYYIFIAWYTRRFTSTFAWFWVVFGILQIGLGILVSLAPDWFKQFALICSIVLWSLFLGIEVLVLSAMLSLPQKNADYIIILGAKLNGKQITGSLKRRLDKGIQYLYENPKTICIVSGGKGKDEEVSEAEAMKEYLENCGIAAERVYMEEKSTTTCENLVYSRSFIADLKKDKIGIISNNFHIYRAMKMAKLLGYEKVFAIPASTNMILFPNYMVREFFAFFIMFSELRKMNKI